MNGNSLAQRPSNMLYHLLPFFLAVQPSAINDTWKYGPKYTFSGHAKMITEVQTDEGLLMGNQLIYNLICRPRRNDTLYCRIKDTKIAKISASSYDVSGNAKIGEYKIAGVMNKPFEIKFNEMGIDSYIIEKTDPPLPSLCIDTTRLICNQLNIGAKIDDISKPFRRLENFTTGECEVNFNISRQNIKINSSDGTNRGFELTSLGSLSELGNDTMKILKKRDIDNCRRRTDYFFGTRYIFGVVYRDVLTKQKNSTSQFFISKTSFTSETTNDVELVGSDPQLQGQIRTVDHLMLKLESIVPANEELPVLRNPVSMEVISTSSLTRNSSRSVNNDE